jgi:hypothetical protein
VDEPGAEKRAEGEEDDVTTNKRDKTSSSPMLDRQGEREADERHNQDLRPDGHRCDRGAGAIILWREKAQEFLKRNKMLPVVIVSFACDILQLDILTLQQKRQPEKCRQQNERYADK